MGENLNQVAADLKTLLADKEQIAVLEERNRMARELHDTLAQGVAGLVLQLEAVKHHLNEGEVVEQPGRSLAYITRGAGSSDEKTLREGQLVDTRDFKYKALSDSQLILVYEN